jgi:hypothetical protein
VTLSLEQWNSDHNRRERHYFLVDKDMHGYQEGQYVFGLNPELIPPEVETKMLEMVNDLGLD